MKKPWSIGLFIFVVILASTPQVLLSQATPAPASTESASAYWSKFKFEIGTAVSYQQSLIDSSYFHQYSPPFLSGAYESQGTHFVKIRGQEGWGFNVGLAYYLSANFGIQLFVDYAKPKLSGPSSPYDVSLHYALTYDASPPYPNTFEYTYEWPETAGDVTEVGVSLNGAVRLPVSKRVAFNLSGGLTYFHVDGKATGISYSYYWWEDGWFKGRTFNVKYKVGPIDRLGFNLGAEFNWVLFSNMCLLVDARYFACSSETLPMTVINENLVTPASPAFGEILFEKVVETMNLRDLTINPSFYRLNIGLKYLF
jgi:hypothetical protein